MNLSHRLKEIASLVVDAEVVADVGTDHGYIPIYLVENEMVKKAIAMDINEGPLARASDNIKGYGFSDRITTRLSDGVEKLCPGEADAIVIAGMGGQLIMKILEKGEKVFREAKQIILSPQSEIPLVRHYLIDNDYSIIEEKMLIDEEKYYTVMKVKSGKQEYNEVEFYEYGKYLLENKDPVLKMFLDKEKDNSEKIYEKICGGNKNNNLAKIEKLKQKIQIIEKSKSYY